MEREKSMVTPRVVRAVRSLVYNRLLLERVLQRIEKAEAIVLSYLLARGDSTTQIGLFHVELDEANHLTITRAEAEGWEQMIIPGLDTIPGQTLDEVREEPDGFQLRT
jgi:hypothetical protein